MMPTTPIRDTAVANRHREATELTGEAWAILEDRENVDARRAALALLHKAVDMLDPQRPIRRDTTPQRATDAVGRASKPVESETRWWPNRGACADDLHTSKETVRVCIATDRSCKGHRLRWSGFSSAKDWERGKDEAA